jgi:hypothetical protein
VLGLRQLSLEVGRHLELILSVVELQLELILSMVELQLELILSVVELQLELILSVVELHLELILSVVEQVPLLLFVLNLQLVVELLQIVWNMV